MKEKTKGITVNGVSLGQFLKKNEYRESHAHEPLSEYFREEQREITEKRKCLRPLGSKSSSYHYKKKISDKGRKLSMREINKDYLKKNLEGQPTLAGKVICVLLTGGVWSPEMIRKEVNKIIPNSHKGQMLSIQDVYSGIARLTRKYSDCLLNKEKYGNGVKYSLHENCYEYSPSVLMKALDKRYPSITIEDIIGTSDFAIAGIKGGEAGKHLKANMAPETIKRQTKKDEIEHIFSEKEEDQKDKSEVSSALTSLAENLIKIVKEVENLKTTFSRIQIDVNVKFGWIKEEK